MKRGQLGEILVGWGAISERQLHAALERQRAQGGRLGEALLALGYCTEAQVYHALAEQFDMPFVDLEATPPSLGAMRLMPRQDALRLGVVPVRLENGRVLAVARNAFDFHVDTEARRLTRRPVLLACGVPSQIDGWLQNYGMERAGMPVRVAERFSQVNRQVEEALQAGAGRVRLEVERDAVRVTLIAEGGEAELARVPLDKLQIMLDARQKLFGTDAPQPPSIRFAQW